MVARVEDRGGSSGYTLRGPIARLVVQARLFALEELLRLPQVVGLHGVPLGVVLALVEVAHNVVLGAVKVVGAHGPVLYPRRRFVSLAVMTAALLGPSCDVFPAGSGS